MVLFHPCALLYDGRSVNGITFLFRIPGLLIFGYDAFFQLILANLFLKLASVLKNVKTCPFDPLPLFLNRQSVKKVFGDLNRFLFDLLLLHRWRNVSLVEYFVI